MYAKAHSKTIIAEGSHWSGKLCRLPTVKFLPIPSMYDIFYLHLPKKLTFHVGKYTIVPWMVWVIGIPRYHGMRARDFLYQSIQCSLEVVAWHLAIEEFEIWKQNSRRKLRNKSNLKSRERSLVYVFTDVTSQFIVHILGFVLNWCHDHGDISWLRSGGICFCSPALFSFFQPWTLFV